MYSAIRTGAVEKVVFVGGSNANQLSFAAAALGVDTYKHAQGRAAGKSQRIASTN